MTRRSVPQPGLEARRETPCSRCDEPIHRGDRYVFRKGWPTHLRCLNGADDE